MILPTYNIHIIASTKTVVHGKQRRVRSVPDVS